MTVPVRGTIRLVNGRITEKVAAEIGERLIALEKALQGIEATITVASPTAPAFGPGAPGGPGTPGTPGTPAGTTEHGALTGLGDDDHQQYVLRGQENRPHVHGPTEIVGLDQTFYRRGESTPPSTHTHRMSDVPDLRPDDSQFVLASRIFGG